MRREALLGTGLLLAAVGEVQRASAFFGPDMLEAILTFVAAAGLFLAAAAFYFPGSAKGALFLGLGAAAVAHVAYVVVTLPWGAVLSVASAIAALGLGVAAWAARSKRTDLLRAGLAGAALAGAVWTGYDLYRGDAAFLVGNVFATVGFAAGAAFAGEADLATT